MPKNLSAGMLAHYAGGGQNVATFVLIRRRLGGIWDPTTDLGFTNYRYPYPYGGLTYLPDDCVDVTTINQAAGTGIGSAQAMAVLRSDRISQEALRGGVYRGAFMKIFNLVWSDPALGEEVLDVGFLGDIKLSGDGVTWDVQYRSLQQLLDMDVQRKVQAPCQWVFGDPATCGIDMTGRRFNQTVTDVSADGTQITFDGPLGKPAAYFAFSPLKATSGSNDKLIAHVKNHAINGGGFPVLYLVTPFAFPVLVGDTFLLEEGCDHTWGGPTGCKAKGNSVRYGGYPQVAGNRKADQNSKGA